MARLRTPHRPHGAEKLSSLGEREGGVAARAPTSCAGLPASCGAEELSLEAGLLEEVERL